MKPALATSLLIGILLVNAAAILFFRYFISIDGPMHVLHASLLEAPWSGSDHSAHGFTYNSGIRSFGDLVLMIILRFTTPEQAHDIYIALLNCALVITMIGYLRAHGTKIGIGTLWLAPLTFNTLLIMGLFHFLLSVAIVFGAVAWWKWHMKKPAVRWAGLLMGALLAWSTHRGAPLLLCLVFLPTVLFEIRVKRADFSKTALRNKIWWLALAGMIAIVGAFQLVRVVRIIDAPIPSGSSSFNMAFLLKTLFILDRSKEHWLVYGIGILLLIALAAGIWGRWRLGRTLLWHDMLIVLFVSLFVVAWLSNSPHGQRLVLLDRTHWLSLIVVALWLIAIADNAQGNIARVIGGAAICALPLHVIRLVQVEKSFSTLEQAHVGIMEACDALEPNSIVLSAKAGTDRLQQHVEAYVAIRHNGILVAPKEFLLSSGPALPTNEKNWSRFTRDPYWLMRHWRKGIPPKVDQVLFIGSRIEQTVSKHPWPVLLGERFRISFENEHARIYTGMLTQKDIFLR